MGRFLKCLAETETYKATASQPFEQQSLLLKGLKETLEM